MLEFVRRTWKFHITILTPILLSLLPLTWTGTATGKEPYAAFVICLMGIFWMTECIPIPVTSFLPIVLFPLFGIISTEHVTSVYLQDSLLFLLGGCIIALTFEYSNLHYRIALKVMMVVGTKVSQLLLGIMATTMILSMWMNNTSTTAMMVPIVNALVEELKTKMVEDIGRRDSILSVEDIGMIPLGKIVHAHEHEDAITEADPPIVVTAPAAHTEQSQKIDAMVQRLRIMFLLGTAYASNIGGTGVLTGSATNLITLDLVRKDSDEAYAPLGCRAILEISFVDWMVFNIPPMLLNTLLTYFYLQIHFMGISKKFFFWRNQTPAQVLEARRTKGLESRIRTAIRAKYDSLGPMGLHETAVLVFFIFMVFLWVFKDPQFMPGWDSLFPKTPKGKSIIKEATPTLLVTVLIFIFPSKWTYFTTFRNGGLGQGLKDPLLSWSFVQQKFPWGIFMLLGGGASMALGAKESGLNQWFGKILASSEKLQSLPNGLLLVLVLILIAALTTVASNTAIAAIITPILLGMSYAKDIHPLFLVLPAATVCSYAFILPVSTPPNAIVYNASDKIQLSDMLLPGFAINLITVAILILTTLTTSEWFFGFNTYASQCQNMTQLLLPS